MNSNRLLKILISVLIIIVAWWFTNRNRTDFEKTGNITGQYSIPNSINTNSLIYTKHAKCRMECRHVDESEVIEIIKQAKVNGKKSNHKDSPCPTIAYEGQSHDGQHLRIVVADCEPRDKIVTVIDLETDYKCDCY